MDRLFFISIVIFSFCYVYAKIKIVELTVPESIEYTGDSSGEIVLDCNYDTEEEDLTELEVKWYHNGDRNPEPIYEWIPYFNKSGKARGLLFKHHLDEEYNVSGEKKMTYRALKLKNITRDLTGNYTCKVSSEKNEVHETKQLIVYSPAKSGIDVMVLEDANMVVCTVEGIFPIPEVEIYISGENGTRIDLEEKPVVDIDDSGYYNVTITHYFENLTDLTEMSNPINFVCSLSIPGTNYSIMGSTEYYLEEQEVYNLTLYDYDGLSPTEDSFNTTKDDNSALPVQSPTFYLSTLLLVLLLLVTK